MKRTQFPSIPPLKALAAFEAAARNMSFAKAAAELNVTPSAISQQIMLLEKYLAIRLFRRLNRRVLLTEAGELYHAAISPAFARISEATARIATDLQPQIIMVRSAPSFATNWLLPRLPEFMAANSDLDVRLDASNETTDFVREAVDIEIRFGKPETASLHIEPLSTERITPLASPLLARQLGILHPKDLASGVTLIHSVKCPISWETWFETHGVKYPPLLRGPRFDRSHMSIEAARMGMGVALEGQILAQEALKRRELVSPVAGAKVFLRTMYWLVCPPANLKSDKTSRFRAWILNHPEVSDSPGAVLALADRPMGAGPSGHEVGEE
ncbi:LysR substrate-binding domain-containing protein [Pikeienuella sp. HZG-20]|uniref:LysR substrate-binding domain-containing protein n=1 Tax=Paludibacillus litoralis TaxID=3133267 RepID=UPI0030ED624C